jgi:glycosyltransferase involved in cell wall biosynthesis
MNNPRVSIIIPIYNGEKFIEECLDSVVTQTFKDFEILVVNDGSTDGSLMAIREWKEKNSNLEKVKVISTSNSGVSSARNTGVAMSRGEYIAFLDCDDYWEAGKLEAQVEALEKDSGCVGSITNFFVVRDSHKGAPRKFMLIKHKNIDSLRFGWLSLLGNGGLISSSLIYRKDSQIEFSRDLSTSADLDFFLRLSSVGRVQIVGAPLANYRIHGQQMHLNSNKLIRDYGFLSKRLPAYGDPILENVLMGNVFAMSTLLEYSGGNFAKGLLFMKESIRANSSSLVRILFSVIWKRIRGKFNLLSWNIRNVLGKF